MSILEMIGAFVVACALAAISFVVVIALLLLAYCLAFYLSLSLAYALVDWKKRRKFKIKFASFVEFAGLLGKEARFSSEKFDYIIDCTGMIVRVNFIDKSVFSDDE